jgi:hypothetical protein
VLSSQLQGLDGGSDVIHCCLRQVLRRVSNLDLPHTTLEVILKVTIITVLVGIVVRETTNGSCILRPDTVTLFIHLPRWNCLLGSTNDVVTLLLSTI